MPSLQYLSFQQGYHETRCLSKVFLGRSLTATVVILYMSAQGICTNSILIDWFYNWSTYLPRTQKEVVCDVPDIDEALAPALWAGIASLQQRLVGSGSCCVTMATRCRAQLSILWFSPNKLLPRLFNSLFLCLKHLSTFYSFSGLFRWTSSYLPIRTEQSFVWPKIHK